jgi:hypothetical protein
MHVVRDEHTESIVAGLGTVWRGVGVGVGVGGHSILTR